MSMQKNAAGSSSLLTWGIVAVGAYFVYEWWFGSGGQADQNSCATMGAMPSATLALMAEEILEAATTNETTPGAFISTWATANPTQAVKAACMRVAISQYPTLALAQAATGSMAAPNTTSALPPPTVASTPVATVATSNAAAAPAFNSLDAIYGRLSSQVGTPPLTPDQFNFYLQAQLPAGVTAPDPLVVFAGSGFDRNATMMLAQYWGAVAPYLSSNMGLSGLGVLGGLSAFLKGRIG